MLKPAKADHILEQSEAEQSVFHDSNYVPTEKYKKEYEKSQKGSSAMILEDE